MGERLKRLTCLSVKQLNDEQLNSGTVEGKNG